MTETKIVINESIALLIKLEGEMNIEQLEIILETINKIVRSCKTPFDKGFTRIQQPIKTKYTEEELRILQDESLTISQRAKKLGRSYATVWNQARRLNQTQVKPKSHFSIEQKINFVKRWKAGDNEEKKKISEELNKPYHLAKSSINSWKMRYDGEVEEHGKDNELYEKQETQIRA